MADHTILTLTILRLATVALGCVFLWVAMRAWLKHRSSSMLFLLSAVGLLVAGVVAEGIMVQVIGTSLDAAHIMESAVMLVAFSVLVASLYAHKIRGRGPVE